MTREERMYSAGVAAAYELMGTAQGLNDVATDEQMNDRSFCAGVDDNVFECIECGWWCETCEDVGDGVCEDCAS